LLLLIIGTIFGCQSNAPTSPTETKTKAFIWKITSDTTYAYLLGSVHIANQEIYPLDSTIENAFESADNLVVEVNTNNISQVESVQLLAHYGQYPEGERLSENLPEELYNQLKEQFQKFGTDILLLNSYRPFVVYNVMCQLIMNSLGYKAEWGMDLYFLDKAQQSGKDILELETAEFQFDLLSSISDESIIEAIQYDIDNPETEKYLRGLFSAWLDGDIAKMESITFEGLTEQPELAPYYEKMYDERNFNMLNKINEFLADDNTYFIVVGAGHLVGENGLINLLKEKGYSIEQLYNSN
jgi:uncharacterized protein YbaP (TraB family)